MLAAADTPAHPLRLAHDLGHQPERVAGAGEEVPVAAVVGEYMVLFAEVLDDRDRIGLLADARVRRPVEQAAFEQIEQALLEAADEAHPAVQPLSARLAGRAYQTSVRPASSAWGCGGHRRISRVYRAFSSAVSWCSIFGTPFIAARMLDAEPVPAAAALTCFSSTFQ